MDITDIFMDELDKIAAKYSLVVRTGKEGKKDAERLAKQVADLQGDPEDRKTGFKAGPLRIWWGK